MNHKNRGRLTAFPGGPWRLYTHSLPGWAMLGTVQTGLQIGALAVSTAGIYAQINIGSVRSLDQRKIGAAIKASNGAQS